MATDLHRALSEAISQATGEDARILERRPLGGGCINAAAVVELADGRRFFTKSNESAPEYFFEREAQGLQALADVGVLRVPGVISFGTVAGGTNQFLVLEMLEMGKKGANFSEEFGRRLAEHHRESTGERFGFQRDNFIGLTPQPNRWDDDWSEFWRRQRLAFQLDMARRKGLSDHELDRLGDRLLDRLDNFIAEPDEPPCLLHGDLWSGNYMVAEDGAPVLIDPAVYYGRREADLAMTRLFGGFDAAFYDAYEEVWPLADGAEERIEVYKLYHLLNHLNLFGGGYYASCLQVVKRLS